MIPPNFNLPPGVTTEDIDGEEDEKEEAIPLAADDEPPDRDDYHC